MTSGLKKILFFLYLFVEQIVFLVALIAGFLVWVSFDSMFMAVFAFFIICIVFWAMPNIVKKLGK